jgi:putative ABC transport system permease protein
MSLTARLYRLLLRLYPASVRFEFGEEMLDLMAARAARERAANRSWAGLRTWWFVARDSMHALPEAYAASLQDFVTRRGLGKQPQLSPRERILLVLGDLRYALRNLLRSRGFAVAAILTLALGIGANTAIFSVVNGVILKPLPYHDADQLVKVGVTRPERGTTMGPMSQPDTRDIQSQVRSLESVAGFQATELTLTGMGDAEAVRGAYVTDGLLEGFREPPFLGRDIRTEENIPGGPRVVVIGHAFWQERLGADRNILGRTLQLSGQPYEIVGVAPPGFDYPRNAQLWVPQYLNVDDCGRGCHFLDVIGRLANGASVDVARSELSALSLRLQEQFPEDNYGKVLDLITLEEETVGDVRTALLVLLGAVAMVLLIACANVANLLLARASVRAGEMALRSALGAARGRIVQQLLLEALLLASIAGVAGVVLAFGGVSWLLSLAPPSIPRLDSVTIDGTVLLFALGTVVLITVLFGLVPALRLAKTPVATVLNQAGRGGPGAATQDWSRSALLVTEVAFSLMLLFGAGLLLRSFSKLNAVELGFDRGSVLTFRISLPDVPYEDDADRTVRFFESLEERIAGLPGVEAVGSAFGSPLGGVGASTSAHFLDRPDPPEGQEEVLITRIVTPGYHEVLRVPLLNGRGLEKSDRNGVPRAALVGQSLVDHYYADKDPIGQQIRLEFGWGYGHEEPWTIVGVVGDIRSQRVTRAPRPEIYVAQAQMGATFLSVLVRTAPGAPDVLPAIRSEVRAIDPNVPLRRVEMLQETVDRQFGPARFYLMLLALFAGVAVVLAGIGLYGVVAYLVSRRTREIGIRMALGAKGGDVVRMVLSQGIRPAVAGIVLGVGGAYWSSRVLQSLLYNVESSDLLTFAGVTALLLGVVVLAILLPARRASRVAPIEALRLE